jgi:hypothetical protein
MADETKTETAETAKVSLTTTQYLKTDGSEADSPLDDARALNFKLNAANRDWTLDLTQIAEAAIAHGVAKADVNAFVAYAGFGAKTKWNNLANSIRNGKLKGTDAANPAAQAAAIDEFLTDTAQGNWRGEAGEGIVAGTADLAEAIVRYQASTGKPSSDAATVEAKLKAMSKEDRAARRNHPGVNAELLKLRAERAVAKAGTASGNDSLLDL